MPRARLARPADAPAILDLHVASIRAFGPQAYDDEQVAAWAAKDGGPERYPLDDPAHHLVVAEPGADNRDGDGQLAGYGHLVPETDDDGEGEVRAVYVHPEHAGSGVGTALLSHLEGYALGCGLDRLHLTASRNAVGFYRRRGYRVVRKATIDREHEGREVPFPVTVMERVLGRARGSEER
jgi:putative acetyltransferase